MISRQQRVLLLSCPVGKLVVSEDGPAFGIALYKIVGLVPQDHPQVKLPCAFVVLAVNGGVVQEVLLLLEPSRLRFLSWLRKVSNFARCLTICALRTSKSGGSDKCQNKFHLDYIII